MSDPALNSTQLVPGYRLDRYELLCPVARGGMAAVWLARFKGKHGFEKLVALKTILPSFAGDPEFRRMFLDEATIAARIEHSNVAQILDLGEHEGTLYLVMEWVEGDSVSRLERAAKEAGSVVPQAIALRIASDACAGLHAAHELRDPSGGSLGVVHRDVSPQNILVSAKGVVKVIDFGIAKARDRASEDTRTGIFKGKLHYMAPEQALGAAVDRRADVWAIAAVLYRLLAQRPVYDANNRSDLLRDLTSNAPLAPLPSHVSGRLTGIIRTALSFSPDARYASCAEFKAELDRAIHAESLYTTTEELAGFVNLHLAAHLEARRQSIKLSLQTVSDETTLPQHAVTVPPARDLGEPDFTHLHAESSAAGEHELRSNPTQIWQRTPNEGSLTAGSTSIQMDPGATKVGTKRKGALAAVALLAGGAGLVGWLFASSNATVNSEAPVTASGTSTAQSSEANAAMPSVTAATAPVPEAVASAEPSPAPAVSVVSLESLALTTAEPSKPRPAPPKATAVKRKRKIIDDGF